jgi:ElaB/YqjD/DUF883 family membrane-anchored ribosome-binding protein
MIHLVATLLLVGYVPGAVLMRAPLGDRSRREALDAGERLFWAIVLSGILSLAFAFCLALVGGYTFERLLLADALASAGPILAWRQRLRYRAAARPGVSLLIPLALAGLTLWLFPPPAEYVIGGKDPGVYVNAGVQIRGSQRVTDPNPEATYDALSKYGRDLTDLARKGASTMSDATAAAQRQLGEYAQSTRRYVSEEPVKSALIAAAIGAAVAALVLAIRRNRRDYY